MENETNRKLILQLYYQKNLQYMTTTIILLFTYFIAIIIALLTRQINLTNSLDLFFVVIVTLFMVGFAIILFNEFNYNLSRIPEEIKKLN